MYWGAVNICKPFMSIKAQDCWGAQSHRSEGPNVVEDAHVCLQWFGRLVVQLLLLLRTADTSLRAQPSISSVLHGSCKYQLLPIFDS